MIVDPFGLKVSRIILWLMMPALLIDALNGWLIRVSPSAGSISQLYRITLMGLIFFWLARHWRNGWLILWGCFSTLLACVTYHSFFYSQNTWLILDLHFQLRLILHFIFFLFLKAYITACNGHIERCNRLALYVRRVFWLSYLVLAINIISGILGIGYSTVPTFGGSEDNGFGGLGFFKAGNDVAATFVAIAGVLMYWKWNESRKIGGYIAFGIISIILSVLLQTKTVIVGMLIMWAAMPLVSSGLLLPNWRIRVKPLLIVLLVLSIFVSIIFWLIFSDMGIIKKFLYFYEEHGLLFAILSGRDYFAGLAIQLTTSSYSFGDVLLGRGWSYYLQGMANLYGGSEKLVEIDYFDVFMIDGLVGLLLQLTIWVFYLTQAYRSARHSSIGRAVLFIDLLLLGIAGTAGHVLYSTLNSMFIALLNTLPILEKAMIAPETRGLILEAGDATNRTSGQ